MDTVASPSTTRKRLVLKIWFDTGEHREVVVKPIHLADAESHPDAKGDMFQALVAGWISEGRPGEFRPWAESIDFMESVEADLPPTNGSTPSE